MSLTVVGALIATMAILYQGFTTADVQLNDGGVWVTKGGESLVAHLNYPSRLLDGQTGGSGELFQDGNDVATYDPTTGALIKVDPAKFESPAAPPLTPASRVSMRAGVAGIIDAGKNGLFVISTDALSGFSAAGRDPLTELGAGSTVAVGVDGAVHAVSAAKHQLVSIASENADPVIKNLPEFGPNPQLSISAVGSVPVVLDAANGVVYTPDKTIEVPQAKGGSLQQASAANSLVLIAAPTGLVEQPLDGSEASLVAVAGGTPSAPVWLTGCAYAVWSGSAAYVRDCSGDAGDVSTVIPDTGSNPQLLLRQNRNSIVVNEVIDGRTWLVNEDMAPVNNWGDLAKSNVENQTEADQPDLRFALPKREPTNHTPRPAPDTFGARAGRTTVLPVLDNDTDQDGDLLVASVVSQMPDDVSVEQVQGGAALQITTNKNRTEPVNFQYQVDDGRPNGKATADVTVNISPAEANSPPKQGQTPTVQLEVGTTGTFNAMMKWTDPDGDEFYLKDASSEAGDRISFRNNGMIQFTEATGELGIHEVTLVMSDGKAEATGTLHIDVRAADTVAPIANADRYSALSGQRITISPLANDLSGNGQPLSLSKIDHLDGTELSLDQASGTFSFMASTAGVYYVQYLVTNGLVPADGIVRVDVKDPDSPDLTPLAGLDTALIPTSRDVLVDVLANDTDPAGGILVVQNVTVPSGAKVSAEVLEHRVIRVTDLGGLSEPTDLTYHVSNGVKSAQGTIRVLPVALPKKPGTPQPRDDRAIVRAGDVVTIDALANDLHPSLDKLTLSPQLVEAPPSSDGVAFVSEGKVRFLAGPNAKSVSLVYRVTDSAGEEGSAAVNIQIIAADPEHNSAPVPQSVTGRAIAGTTVRVPIPLDGIDPNGDSVELLGIASAPKLGWVSVGQSWLEYHAYPGAAGSDSFEYLVRDRLGATAKGSVVVGVAAPSNLNQAPYTVRDEVTIRPGRTVSVAVLQNDSDPDGDDLALVSNDVQAPAGVTAKAVKGRILVEAPKTEGEVAITYFAVDPYGAKTQGLLTLNVKEAAELQAPIARDDYVTAAQLVSGPKVEIAVLDNDEDPDGVVDELTVSCDDPSITVGTNGVLTTAPTPEARTVLYTVTDADNQSATAVIFIPGTASLLPTLRSAEPVQVVAGKELRLPLADYVTVRSGRQPRISQADNLRAEHAVNESLIADEHTLTYTADETYYGGDAISVLVTDGTGPDDPEANSAYLAIPIQVLPAKNQPPTFLNTEVTVTPGEPAVDLNWRKLASDPDPDDQSKLTAEPVKSGDGLVAEVKGDHLLISAKPDTKVGTQPEVTLAISDGTNPAVTGTVTVSIVLSQKALPVAVDDPVPAAYQGQPTTVHVLANDLPNPFPETPLTLLSAKLVSGQGKVEVKGSDVIVTPAADFHGTLLATYRVQDAMRTPEREAEATIRVTVQGRPDRPDKPVVVSEGDRSVVLSWTAPASNGRRISGYTVSSTVQKYSQHCATTTCTLKGLTNDVKYTFTVTATNDVGESDPSPASAVARPDVRPNTPDAPTLVRADRNQGGALELKWSDPGGNGSKVQNYDLVLDSGQSKLKFAGTSATWEGLTNGTYYRVMIRARNLAKDPSEWSQWSVAAKPFGIPNAPGKPTTQPATPVGSQAQIKVSWNPVTGADTNGDDVANYDLEVRHGGSVERVIEKVAGTSTNVTVDTSTTGYSFRVRARNGAGNSDWGPESETRRAAVPPGAPKNINLEPGDHKIKVTFSDGDLNGSKPSEVTYHYTSNHSGGGTIKSGDTITGLTNGTSYKLTIWATSNIEGVQEGAKATSEAAVPFGKPIITLDGIDRLDNAVRFRWHVDSNGAALTTADPGLNGNSGEQTKSGLSPSQSTSITVTYGNRAGTNSETWSGQANDPPPPSRSVNISKSDKTVAGCTMHGGGECPRIHLVTSGFSGSYSCDFYRGSGGSPWVTASFRGDVNDYSAYFGFDDNIWTVCDGVRSNTLDW